MSAEHIPLSESPLTDAERTRVLDLLDQLALVLGTPDDWGSGSRMAMLTREALRIRFLVRNSAPAQDLDKEEARINAMVEAAAMAMGAIATDENILATVALALLGMLGETADELAHKLIQRQGRMSVQQAPEAPGGHA